MRSSGILFALWPQSINFYFKLKNQKRAASKRPIVWKRHSKGIYVAYVHTSILLHYFFSFKALDGLTLYGLQLCLMAPTQYISHFKKVVCICGICLEKICRRKGLIQPPIPRNKRGFFYSANLHNFMSDMKMVVCCREHMLKLS